ncbi:MAG: 2-C-methyl-D-erythritol 4-phosphate cytidylyltransferase [Candidatus Micrarchaeota archaeon]|nr:2-C-methyl-D-erythritol 4-phosphate cytidylyltransferase [Candidatus Micrarchaeota archaeon]
MEPKLSSYVIIGAGGKGERMGRNKQLLELKGKPVVIRTLEVFDQHPLVDGIILVRPAELDSEFKIIVDKFKIKKIVEIVDSGVERQYSMYNGLQKVPKCSVVLFHNGANPLVTEREITECVKEAFNYGAAAVASPVKDTIKRAEGMFVKETLKRSELWAMQTPQAMRYEIAIKAYEFVIKNNIQCTDDVQAVEIFDRSIPIRIVLSSPQNIKLTTPADIKIAESFLSSDYPAQSGIFDFVYGIGEDSHEFMTEKEIVEESKLGKRRVLNLGGITISSEMAFRANSDGDAVLHAISRAILSSISGPSLDFFADDLAKKGQIDSKVYLRAILSYAKEKGYVPNEARIIIEAGKPRLSFHIEKMKESISSLLGIEKERVGFAIHSGEKLSPFGHGKGIRAFAFVSMKKITN